MQEGAVLFCRFAAVSGWKCGACGERAGNFSVKCTFWGSHVETVRRNSLVPRCPPGACQRRLLPLPVLVVLIFRCFLVQVVKFLKYGVCKFICLSSFVYKWFRKELRFFFSLLKRKKEAKKEKSSRITCTARFQYHPKILQRIFHLCKIFCLTLRVT